MAGSDLPRLEDALRLRALDAAADRPPLAPRQALVWQGQSEPFGSTPPQVLNALREAGCALQTDSMTPDSHLQAVAATLRRLGLTGRWRDEAIRVPHPQAPTRIERGCARVLGIQTLAVHLIGFSADGRVWLQQRAASKAEDPNLWDTLVGGMVGVDESPQQALQRETWEEAGLHLNELGPLREAPRLHSRRPVSDAGGLGYLQERLITVQATLPEGLRPRNQDGEVQDFALWSKAELRTGMERGELTLDAARLLLRLLQWQ